MDRTQIAKSSELKKQDRKDYETEGQLVREKQEIERVKIERIKEEKLKELHQSGIPEKYKAELSRKKIV